MTAVAPSATYIALRVEPDGRSIVASDGTTYTVPLASVGPSCAVESVALLVKPVLASAPEARRDNAPAMVAVIPRHSGFRAARRLFSICRGHYTKNGRLKTQ